MPGQEKMVMEFYQKNPSALASLRGNVYEEKIINLLKTKAKSTKKNITKDEAEKIIKSSHDHHHDHSKDTSTSTSKKSNPIKKAKSTATKSEKVKKVSKK
jgi:trigger factor